LEGAADSNVVGTECFLDVIGDSQGVVSARDLKIRGAEKLLASQDSSSSALSASPPGLGRKARAA
jgi:hypothetical protein